MRSHKEALAPADDVSAALESIPGQQQNATSASTGQPTDETQRISALRKSLNYAAVFEAAGESYSEADIDGRTIVHPGRKK